MTVLFGMILAIGPFLLLAVALLLWKRLVDRDERRDPINIKVLRGAGDSLRSQVSKHAEEFDVTVATAMMIGPFALCAWAMTWMVKSGFQWATYRPTLFDGFLLLLVGAAFVQCFRLLIRHAIAGRKYRQGLAAELAVAQSLTQVMAEGGLVFHDFPGDGFNIDHIVIGTSAVFAVETKSRRKPARGGKESARVLYDGNKLAFPDHFETAPLEQAKRQADWLHRFLASGVGEPVRVVPYVALPGWYVESKVPRADVLVGNPRNPMFMVGSGFGAPLGEVLKRRIAHVLSERYPMDGTVTPTQGGAAPKDKAAQSAR